MNNNNNDISKIFKKNMIIDACLQNIKTCTKVASDYLEGIIDVYDLEELIVSLRCVEEDILEIDSLIMEIEEEYEKEIEMILNEQ